MAAYENDTFKNLGYVVPPTLKQKYRYIQKSVLIWKSYLITLSSECFGTFRTFWALQVKLKHAQARFNVF